MSPSYLVVRIVPAATLATLMIGAVTATAQPVPQPFPRPGEPTRRPGEPRPAPAPEQPPQTTPPAELATQSATEPNEASLGLPVYPGSQFLVSYDAGKGQRYYLFGTNATFEDMVIYYRNVVRDDGDRVFSAPPTHFFEMGRFREETMAFPPSVTVKDYTWNGSEGYLNPDPGNGPARFRTILQVVPPPVSAPPR